MHVFLSIYGICLFTLIQETTIANTIITILGQEKSCACKKKASQQPNKFKLAYKLSETTNMAG